MIQGGFREFADSDPILLSHGGEAQIAPQNQRCGDRSNFL
jgi:hypothetical protein